MLSEHAQMVDDCQKRAGRLDDWQRDFIASIAKQLVDGRALTKAQADKLDEVWEAATARG